MTLNPFLLWSARSAAEQLALAEAEAKAEEERSILYAKRLEDVREHAQSVMNRFKPLGAAFTDWSHAGDSEASWPKLNAYFSLPNGSRLYQVLAEPDGYTFNLV
jgi:hypothetical protein